MSMDPEEIARITTEQVFDLFPSAKEQGLKVTVSCFRLRRTGSHSRMVLPKPLYNFKKGTQQTAIGLDSFRWLTLPWLRDFRTLSSTVLVNIDSAMTLQWSNVVKLQQSLYREAPGMDKFRPDQRTDIPNFYLSGSYTYQDYIDSMEGATKSGLLCAGKLFLSTRKQGFKTDTDVQRNALERNLLHDASCRFVSMHWCTSLLGVFLLACLILTPVRSGKILEDTSKLAKVYKGKSGIAVA